MDKLPKGWSRKQIGEIATKVVDGSHNPPKDKGVGIPMISAQNVINGRINLNASRYITEEEFNFEQKRIAVQIGDILLTIVGTIGRSAVVDNIDVKFAIQRSVAVIRITENPYFVNYYFQSPQFVELILINARGAAQQGLYLGQIKALPIPLPPLPEQTRIVNKLDSLFERIDKSMALLEENIKHTEALMASVLDEIFSKINAERFQVKDLSKNIQYGYTGKALDKGEYYYLRITDIQNGKVNFSNTPYSDIPVSQIDKYLLKHGDILFARTGATAGKSYLYNDNEKSVFASYLIRVVCNEEVLIPNYLYCFFQSKGYWNQIFGNIVGAAQPNFNGKKLGEIVVPLPDINTQQKIIEKFESLNKYFEQITFQQQSKLSYLKALKASLLDKAFKGEL